MVGSAIRRLTSEYKSLCLNPTEGIIARPIDENNLFEWEVTIIGPEGTFFEGGVFPGKLIFPPDYPLNPPTMQFTCEMFHPNIYADGRVCISILHASGRGYEDPDKWSPVLTIEKILISVLNMLLEPNPDSAANVDAAIMWREDRDQYNKITEILSGKS